MLTLKETIFHLLTDSSITISFTIKTPSTTNKTFVRCFLPLVIHLRLELNWTDKFVLGVKSIDDQHFELVNRINKLIVANNTDENIEIIQDLLSFLKNYVVEHFSTEEELQREYSYPEYKEHRVEHFDFVKRVAEFENQYKKYLESESKDKCKNLLHEINGELVNWLSKHIDGSDRKVAEHILKQQKNN